MDVYYNADFGCIVCPQTTVGNTPMRVVIEPVAVLRKGFTETALGEAILAALERSRTGPPGSPPDPPRLFPRWIGARAASGRSPASVASALSAVSSNASISKREAPFWRPSN